MDCKGVQGILQNFKEFYGILKNFLRDNKEFQGSCGILKDFLLLNVLNFHSLHQFVYLSQSYAAMHKFCACFCRCCFHGEICRSKLPVLEISKKTQKRAFSYSKIGSLEIFFIVFFLTHLVGLSKRIIFHPQTLIKDTKWVYISFIYQQHDLYTNYRN